jgi:hypothetical protein
MQIKGTFSQISTFQAYIIGDYFSFAQTFLGLLFLLFGFIKCFVYFCPSIKMLKKYSHGKS